MRIHTAPLLAFIALVLAGAGVLVMLSWAFESENVLEVKNAPFPVRIVNDGSNRIIVMHVNYCKNTDIKGKVRVSYVSATEETFLPVADENGPKQCLETDVPIIVPKDLKPDKYKVKFRVTYDLNPLKKGIVDEFDSQEFDLAELNN